MPLLYGNALAVYSAVLVCVGQAMQFTPTSLLQTNDAALDLAIIREFNFMHIPKSGGTTFLEDTARLAIKNGGENRYCDVQQPVVTMLRSPRSHVLSQFLHCKTSIDHKYARSFLDNVSFQTWLEKWNEKGEEANLFCCYNPHNLQKRYLTCKTGGEVAEAKQRVNIMEVTGILELYQETQCLVHYKTNALLPAWCNCMDKKAWNSAEFSHIYHGVAPHSIEDVSHEELALLDQLIRDDEALYEHAVERFKDEIKKVEEASKVKILCEDRALHQKKLSSLAWVAFEDKDKISILAGEHRTIERAHTVLLADSDLPKQCVQYKYK